MARIFLCLITLCSTILANSQTIQDLGCSTQIINNQVEINWVKANDAKIFYYALEKLNKDNQWEKTKMVRPKVDQMTFITTDEFPDKGMNVYRIRMKTREGNYIFSPTFDVNFEPLKFDLMVYPNPANAWLVVNSDNPDEDFLVHLVDNYGNKLVSQDSESGSCVINTAEILEGMYFIKVDGAGAEFKKAVVINHR